MCRRTRIIVVDNVPAACNRATADFNVPSPLMDVEEPRMWFDRSPRTDV